VDERRKHSKANQSSIKSFLRLFRQLIQAHKIPFTGEPLKGLQVMGVLETRNLDYKNVFILSLNEGAFPSSASKGSYIPFNIRKAYGLPTVEHQDAMYAYLFYRVLQRAENIFLFYNSETDVLGQGEMSRYLQQLVYESGLKMERKVLHNPIQPRPINPIVISKDEGVLEALAKLSEGNSRFKGISPSALNTYIECRLRFYLRHVAKIKEADEVEEDLDARVLGNFLHEVMELFYKHIRERKGKKLVEASDLNEGEALIDKLIDEVFIDAYRLDPSKQVQYEGQRLVVREVVKRFAHRIVEMDKAYAPFVMEALEQEGLLYNVKLDKPPGSVLISGKIDRVDRKDNLLRVIDYKTGKDKLDFDSVASLFSRDQKRNKAAFQTMLYALLYKTNAPSEGYKIVPGLINRMNLFDKNFQFGLKVGKTYVEDVDPLLGEFELHLRKLLEELFDPEVPFDQTTDTEICRFCPYEGICYR
ncbi:MAG: PD-(D/E)XK nuclease family protein, partial [Marivirga sp.]|nr:PD-(D/E)XK nuclease family protein [Marivirga sp.]